MSIVGDLVANLTANVSGFIAPMQSAIRMVGVFGAGFSFVEAINSFRESEQAAKKLDAVLTATEGAAGLTADEITGFANELQGLTNFEGDATVAAAAVLATFKEIKGQTFKDAIVSAQDLSAVMGQDLQGSIVQIGKALNDPVKGVTALQRVGVSFTQQQKDQIALLQKSGDLAGAQAIVLGELQSEFGGAAKAMADPFTVIWNSVGDIVEMVGGAMVPALNVVATALSGYLIPNMEAFQESFKWVSEIAVEFATSAIGYIKDSFKLLGVVVVQWENIVALAFAKANLAWEQFSSTFSYFTGWIGRNWKEVFTDMAVVAFTFLTNLGKNMGELAFAIFNFFSSGDWEFQPIGLLDGFEASLKEIPDLASRAVSDTEKKLQGEVDSLGNKLADSFGEALIPDISAPVISEVKKASANAGKIGDSFGKRQKGVEAFQMGSKEAISAIFASMRVSKDDKLLSLQEQAIDIQRQQLGVLETIANDESEVVDI